MQARTQKRAARLCIASVINRLFVITAGVTILALAGCGGSQPPIAGADGGAAVHRSGAGSSILPRAKSGDLLYLSDLQSHVYVYTYPQGVLEATLSLYAPAGECADASGDVWITLFGSQQIVEYEHGGTSAISILQDPNSEPFSCSIDPSTGDLAVSNLS